MKLRKPWMIKLAARLGHPVLRMWMGTLRFRVEIQGGHIDPRDPTMHEHFIYICWHDSLFLLKSLYSIAHKTAALISQSADGDLIAEICARCGMRTVRGSSSRGGAEALRELLQIRNRWHILVVPDGPRGPRHEVKRGLVQLAMSTGMGIVPVGAGFQDAWRTNSWDRMALPKPWSRMTCVAGPAIYVPADADKATLESYRLAVERGLETATMTAQALAEGRRASTGGPTALARAA